MDWNHWTPRERANLCFIVKGEHVLLIRKKRGFGAGKINGPGGKIEPGETVLDSAIRETQEEVGVTPLHLEKRAELHFQFTDGYSVHCTVFVADSMQGVPVDTAEATPLWFRIAALPFDEMWADDRLWLPQILSGKSLQGWFIFEGEKMQWSDVRTLD